MVKEKPAVTSSPSPIHPQFQRHTLQAQETLYEFLLDIVKTWDVEDVLQEFKRIFIQPIETSSLAIVPAVYQILFANQEQVFRNTLKRSCYILINNWEIARNHHAIQSLVQLFIDPVLEKPTLSLTLKRLRQWLKNFVGSSDYAELKLFAEKHDQRHQLPWSHRYAPYLLVSQYTNLENPLEQRQAARKLYGHLKYKFKHDLAMYTAHCLPSRPSEIKFRNPTLLGDDLLYLIQKIVTTRGFFNYSNLARIFAKQVQDLKYVEFKASLLEYLVFSLEQSEMTVALRKSLTEKLDSLYVDHNSKPIDGALLLRTANRVIEYLTTENREEASPLFVLLLSRGNALTLVILLLKVILICQYSQIHLEARIADLIKRYEQYEAAECQWMIHFVEVFYLTMTIHTENVEFNLVNMAGSSVKSNPGASVTDAVTYRIFSQLKQSTSSTEPDLLEFKAWAEG